MGFVRQPGIRHWLTANCRAWMDSGIEAVPGSRLVQRMKLDDVQAAAQAQFGRQSANYGSSHILADTADLETAVTWFELPAGAHVLDVATGGGHTGLFFARRGCRVTLSDLTQPMLDRAARTAADMGLDVEVRQHPAETMPYPDGSFDLVTCRIAPHHFTAPGSFVKESARVLRPGGFFLLIDGTVSDDQPEAEAWAHEVEKLRDPSHNRLLTPGAWARLCAEAGLMVKISAVAAFKQPDLDWYFQVAATPEPNRDVVRRLVREAPESARRLFRIGMEGDKIVWWWERLSLLAQKPA
jgi:SAM-dependent methyltransferase